MDTNLYQVVKISGSFDGGNDERLNNSSRTALGRYNGMNPTPKIQANLHVNPSVRDNPQKNLAQLGVQQVDVINIEDAPVSLCQQSWQKHRLALDVDEIMQHVRPSCPLETGLVPQ